MIETKFVRVIIRENIEDAEVTMYVHVIVDFVSCNNLHSLSVKQYNEYCISKASCWPLWTVLTGQIPQIQQGICYHYTEDNNVHEINTVGSGGRAVECQTVNSGYSGSIPPTVIS